MKISIQIPHIAFPSGRAVFLCATRVFSCQKMCKIREKTCQKGICVVKVSWVGITLPGFAVSLCGGHSRIRTISPPGGVEMSEGNPPKADEATDSRPYAAGGVILSGP